MKMMKERGCNHVLTLVDLTENEVKKMKEHKNKDKGETKPKSKVKLQIFVRLAFLTEVIRPPYNN
jgi:CRISPR/Cas system CSM-associated protein Csm3 (group 7 of RAMP superfamily)